MVSVTKLFVGYLGPLPISVLLGSLARCFITHSGAFSANIWGWNGSAATLVRFCKSRSYIKGAVEYLGSGIQAFLDASNVFESSGRAAYASFPSGRPPGMSCLQLVRVYNIGQNRIICYHADVVSVQKNLWKFRLGTRVITVVCVRV